MGKVYATSDWHSCDFYKEVLNQLNEDDILYFIGDAIDRGPAGIWTFNALWADKRVIMLKGNHEYMLAQYLASKEKLQGYVDINGGDVTMQSMSDMTDEEKEWYIKTINKLPEEIIYHSPKGHAVILEHAGYSPFDMPRRSHDALWDRSHFSDEWNSGFDKNNLNPKNTYLVHGHTPVQYLKFIYGFKDKPAWTMTDFREKEEFFNDNLEKMTIKPEIIRYCNGHKFDIDMCTIVTDRIALLDLDTFEEIYFDRENLKK